MSHPYDTCTINTKGWGWIPSQGHVRGVNARKFAHLFFKRCNALLANPAYSTRMSVQCLHLPSKYVRMFIATDYSDIYFQI